MYYQVCNQWLRIPPWASFLIEVGRVVGSLTLPDMYLRLILSLPSRGYAAAFISLGVAAAFPKGVSGSTDASDYFQMLCSLSTGASVICTVNGRNYHGVLGGLTEFRGEPSIKVRIQNARGGDLSQVIRKSNSQCIRVVERSHGLPARQKGRTVKANCRFVAGVLGSVVDPTTHASSGRRFSLLIGSTSDLRQELCETTLGIYDGRSIVPGNMNDVVRAAPFLPEIEGNLARVYSGNKDSGVDDATQRDWHVILCDGASNYLKWASRFADSHAVVVLDSTARAFEDAVRAANQAFVQDRVDAPGPSIPSPPSGVEMLAYWEGGRKAVSHRNG